MENKYKEGDVVYAISDPSLKLIIRRYLDKIYYCKILEDPGHKELTYFETELAADLGTGDEILFYMLLQQ